MGNTKRQLIPVVVMGDRLSIVTTDAKVAAVAETAATAAGLAYKRIDTCTGAHVVRVWREPDAETTAVIPVETMSEVIYGAGS